ncbi:hypothetical protein CBR_g23803 [Chara braunii]|uniref:DUF659 domain-containing protein n=1 Tax=Chara braunii TaxID=69332 RepID=A0A388JVK9_CHABU|nr:hypothetical protein CBR_g23803 [Chara braunii]|eukprot:GBG61849.1 hypothetical protein CBR_g23803 [Chara braunii]
MKLHFIVEGMAGKHAFKGSKRWKCKYCEQRFSGTATKLSKYFVEKGSLDYCMTEMSVEERTRREEGISQGEWLARVLLHGEASGSGPSNSQTAAENVPQVRSSQVGAAGISDETPTPQSTAGTFHGSKASKPVPKGPLRHTLIEEERTSRFLDRFLICTNQSFSLVEDEYFLEFIDAVKKAHSAWMPCRRDEQRTKRLDADYAWVGAESVRSFGSQCAWRARRRTPVGTVFWKSLDGVIKEIGADTVVGVVMDNARVCVKAGKMVEAAYPNIFRVGCTAHALDLALEDMYKHMPWMAEVVDAGNKVGKFFTNVDKARAMFHNYSPKTKLKRPAATRFATNFTMLGSLKELKNALDRCVCDVGWVEKMVRAEQLVAFNEVTAIILDKGEFWNNLNKALDVMQPVVELLRLVDGQGPTISKVYFKMDRFVQRMRALECLSTFLDPEHRMQNAQRDPEVRTGFNIWLYPWMPRDKLKEVSFQVDQWVNALGGFSTEEAREQASQQPPALWWEAFGSKHDLLAPQVIKLLGQASSSAACERNWSLHELIYGRRRTKLMPERMAKLVYNSWNVRLLKSIRRGGGDEFHIPWADDGPVDKEMEEWYADWLKRVHGEVEEEEAVVADVKDEEDEFPLRRTFQFNDEVDERLCEEDSVLVGTRERDWHECTKPGKYRERELRRRSGSELPVPQELYTEEGYALALAARRAGTWVEGREEGPRRRRTNKGKQKVDGNAPVQCGKRKAVEQQQPQPKRGRPTLAEQAERRARKAEEKAAKAAADAAAAKAAAVKDDAAKAGAAAKADAKNAAAGKMKRATIINDDDDDDIPEDIRGDEELKGSTSTSSSSSDTSDSGGGGEGTEESDEEEGGEGEVQPEESEEEGEQAV